MTENIESGNPLDILTQDLSGVSTSMPLLREGIYDCAVSAAEVKPTRDGTGQTFNATLKTTKSELSTTGETLGAGMPVYDTIGLTPTEKYTVEAIKRKCAAFAQAVGVKSLLPVEALLNKIVRVKIGVQPERTDPKTGQTYEARNVIKIYLKA